MLEASGARAWLDELDQKMKTELANGGFYQAIQNFNLDLIWAGCALLYTELNTEGQMVYECCQVGTYLVQTTSQGKLEAVARRLVFSYQEACDIFGEGKLSERARARGAKNPLTQINVWHLVRPLRKSEIKSDEQFKASSLYWEDGAKELLKQSGFFEMPYFFARWNDGATSYGTGPGDLCLADAQQLDRLETYKLSGLGKLVDPPVMCSHSLKETIDLSAGAINFVTDREVITPILDLSPYASSMRNIAEEIAIVSKRLNQGLMAAIFASMPLEQRPAGMSATEFLERKREAMQQLGPIMSAYEPLVLTPLLLRLAMSLERNNFLPPPPEALQNIPLFMKMDFSSPMATALKQASAETTRAMLQDVASIFQATRDQSVLDKLDIDQTVDVLAQSIGCPGSIIRADEDVAQIRQQRQQAQQQAAQQQAMQQAMQQAVSQEPEPMP